MAGVDADRGARAAVGRIRHGPRREDALRRARPAARLRGAPDDRRLSRELRLDAGLAPPAGRAPPLVPQHGEPAPGGGAGVGDADRLRRRGLVPRGAKAPGAGTGRRRQAVLPHRLVHQPARSLGGAVAPLGSVRRRGRGPSRDRPGVGSSQPAPAGHVRARRAAAHRGGGRPGPAGLPRGGQLRRRAHRRGPLGARGVRSRRRHGRRLHRRSRRAPGRARALVQDVVPRPVRARAADRARAGSYAAAGGGVRLAARPCPHARGAHRGRDRRRRARGSEPRAASGGPRRRQPARRSPSTWRRASRLRR